jgi:type IV pilus assembly protein PilQ
MTGSLKRIYIFLALVLAAAALFCLAGPALAVRGLAALQGTFAPAGQESATLAPLTPADPVPPGSPGAVSFDNTPQAAHYDAPRVYTGERISLDFQNAELHNVIRIIGEVSGKNIVVSDKVTGKVTLKLKDVPWDQALDIVLASRNLGVEEAGNVLTIYDLQTLNNIRADRQRLAAERNAAALQAPLTKKVFTPKYAPVGVMTEELRKLTSARGKIVAIGNDIYVEDEPGAVTTMSQLFMRLDRVTRQILIESRIVVASAQFTEALGVSWGGMYDGSGLMRTTARRLGVDGSAFGGMADLGFREAGVSSLGFAYLNKAANLLLGARLRAEEATGESRTISAPRIMAADNQTVSIKQGTQIPYQTGGSANTPANIEFKEAVLELKVTPHIEENGQIVTLDIDLKNDSPTLLYGETAANARQARTSRLIAINTRQAKTKLMVRDGDTVVIGGIMQDTQASASSRVPGLHRLPLLGWLFQENEVANSKEELLIFITANIIPVNI